MRLASHRNSQYNTAAVTAPARCISGSFHMSAHETGTRHLAHAPSISAAPQISIAFTLPRPLHRMQTSHLSKAYHVRPARAIGNLLRLPKKPDKFSIFPRLCAKSRFCIKISAEVFPTKKTRISRIFHGVTALFRLEIPLPLDFPHCAPFCATGWAKGHIAGQTGGRARTQLRTRSFR